MFVLLAVGAGTTLNLSRICKYPDVWSGRDWRPLSRRDVTAVVDSAHELYTHGGHYVNRPRNCGIHLTYINIGHFSTPFHIKICQGWANSHKYRSFFDPISHKDRPVLDQFRHLPAKGKGKGVKRGQWEYIHMRKAYG